ncbi:carbohydrate-binding protein [Paenibacillus hexagrammi]|uniref:Carbohydrate-binding protein n=1 Tax=Paenibacillus hexagrammi TaxID=2908839 RepID=A0ABY3SE28_9BACL|nr:carbohydrate-binding protein [Paenibacillus sp. YPD9-1]UJF31386.1 carbohydrate-binding protein [Paenibacillus sp. YPD9-1]
MIRRLFIDDDGQAYLYWGNNALYYAKLNDDMISLDGDITAIPLTTDSIGPDYEEAPWVYKRDGLYYLVYASGFPESIRYSTSTSPTGPWTYRGVVMPQQGTSSTNHPGIIDYKGNSYFFYHKAGLPGGGSYKRSVSIEKFEYNADGTIPTFNMTTAGVANSTGHLNPYTNNEAETIAWESGITTEPSSQGGMVVSSVDNGDYIKVESVDFGDIGAGTFKAQVASSSAGGTIELHLDSADGALIGTLPISNTGGDSSWMTKATTVSGAVGVHDLYMVYRGASTGNLFTVDNWQFGEKSAVHDLAAINASSDTYKIDTASGTNKASMKVTAIYTDGTSEDVTAQAAITPEQSGIVSVSGGAVTGVGYGSTSINVSYGGKTDSLNMLVKDMNSELTVKRITVDNPSVALDSGKTAAFKVTAEYLDGHTEDVTQRAEYRNPSPGIADVSNGTITAKASGTTDVVVSYKGELGDAVSAQIHVTVNTPTVVAIEAEKAAENSADAYVIGNANGHTWSLVDGESTKAMQFLPDDGTSVTPGTDAASLAAGSKLGYKVNFPTSGTYNVWILAKSHSYQTDSIHVGLDNQYKFTSNGIQGVSNGQFKWVNLSNGGDIVTGGTTLNISAGMHELNFWGRESGLSIDRIYLTTSNATTDPVWLTTPKGALLGGPTEAAKGSTFELNYGLSGMDQNVYAQDVTFTYDPSQVEFVSAESENPNQVVIVDKAQKQGEVRFIAATIGQNAHLDGSILKLHWKVKSDTAAAASTISLSKGIIADQTGAEKDLESRAIAVRLTGVVVDKTALLALITDAQTKHDAAAEGTGVGQYPVGSKAVLQTAIDQAKAIADNSSSSQQQVEQAVVALTTALQTFMDSVVTKQPGDVNNDGRYSVGDLGMVAAAYGKTSADPNWSTYKDADLNNDGKIDIEDLAAMARQILN